MVCLVGSQSVGRKVISILLKYDYGHGTAWRVPAVVPISILLKYDYGQGRTKGAAIGAKFQFY